MEAFTVTVTQSEGACRLALAGELDAATAPILHDALAAVRGHVRIDCQQLTFADSSGIAELLALTRQVESVHVVNPTMQLRRSLEILDLATILGVEEDAVNQVEL